MSTAQFSFDNELLEISIEEYIKFKREPQYQEKYKFDTIDSLNRELNVRQISSDTIVDIIKKLQKANPNKGGFVDWRCLSSLLQAAEEQPHRVTQLFRNLFNESLSLSERIGAFKSEAKGWHGKDDRPLQLNTSLFGYILTAFNKDNYTLYKGRCFEKFTTWHSIDCPSSVEERYELYIAMCKELKTELQKRMSHRVTLLDVQDFLYCTFSYDVLLFRIIVRYLHRFSAKLRDFEHDTSRFLQAISSLDTNYLDQEKTNYSRADKVRKIRFLVIDHILTNGTITVNQLESIKNNVNKEYDTNILQSWNNFRILFQIYYDYYKQRVNNLLQELRELLLKQNPLNTLNFNQRSIFDFSWNQNFGSTECYILLYPAAKVNHNNAMRLYFDITPDYIMYGLSSGKDFSSTKIDDGEKADPKAVTLQQVMDKYRAMLPQYERLNQARSQLASEQTDQSVPMRVNWNTDFEIKSLHYKNKNTIEEQIQQALQGGKNLILIGPPGTGKTKLAREICEHYCVDYHMATASADWTAFDTIGGYVPTQGGTLEFKPGIFLQCFKDAQGQSHNKWLIIDEINRADIDKAFGALFSVLTGQTVTLPFEARNGSNIILRPEPDNWNGIVEMHEYVVPTSWRLIATMNSIDKASLYEMSYAFMRRFAFIPAPVPKKVNKADMEIFMDKWGIKLSAVTVNNVIQLWESMNKYRKIGPAIIEDICRYLVTSGNDYASALIMYVLPQFEGLMQDTLEQCVKEITQLHFIDDSAASAIKDFMEDFFGFEDGLND